MAIQNNFSVEGSVSITSAGIASGFSSRNAIVMNKRFQVENLPWEFNMRVRTGADITTRQKFNGGVHNMDYQFPTLEIVRNTNSNFCMYLSSTGSSWDIASKISGTYQVLPNTWYQLRWGWSGTEYYFEYALDDSVFIRDITVVSSVPVFQPLYVMGLGNDLCSFSYQIPFLGDLDLMQTNLQIGGEVYWMACEDVGIIPGNIIVGEGYYNADGTNIIKFLEPQRKTLNEATTSSVRGFKNSVYLTLASDGFSSFLLQKTDTSFEGNYQALKKIEGRDIYLDESKQYILDPQSFTKMTYQIDMGHSDMMVWQQPTLTSATSYGTVSDSRNSGSEAGWKCLDGLNNTNFVPATSAGWWKWEIPVSVSFEAGNSTITWIHRSNSESMSGSDTLQFFADEEMTIPLTDPFSDSGLTANQEIIVPVITTTSTSLIYLNIKAHAGYGGASEIVFNNVLIGAEPYAGAIKVFPFFEYCNEEEGYFQLTEAIEKGLEEAVVGSKQETMFLYLVKKEGKTDFVLSAHDPSGYDYFEKRLQVTLDETLFYIADYSDLSVDG